MKVDEKFTLRERLEGNLKRAKARGNPEKIAKIEEELTLPPLPACRAYVLMWFFELGKSRSYSQMGDPLSLTSGDYLNWVKVYRRSPLYSDLELLRTLDDLYLTAVHNSRSG